MIRTIIVEDDPMVADLAAGYLERIEGVSLDHTARSAEDGLELLRTCHVDLVLLDVFKMCIRDRGRAASWIST